MARTHYQMLGVPPHASHEDIRRAYHRQARSHHPDANPDSNPDAQADAAARSRRMAEINAAWEVLGDPDKRLAYDLAIGSTPRPRPFPAGGSAGDPDDGDGEDDLGHLFDGPEPVVRSRPSDLLVAIPIVLLVIAVLTFFFSAMSQSTGLRTASLMLVPVTAGSFIAAPLFVMLRARSRDDDKP